MTLVRSIFSQGEEKVSFLTIHTPTTMRTTVFIVAAFLLISSASCSSILDDLSKIFNDKVKSATFAAAADLIKEDFNYQRKHNAAADMNTCIMADASSCDISSLPYGNSTLVIVPPPSNEIPDVTKPQCIFGEPYGFQVIPGDKNKVLVYFQGGGACWDQITVDAGMCTTSAVPNDPVGVFDRINPKNPFKDYTIVHFLYCSGEVWSGQTVSSYSYDGKPAVQVGIVNAKYTINWMKRQISLGLLGNNNAPAAIASNHKYVFDEFVGMGCSAGSVGIQMWSDQLISTFPSQQMAIVPDSYAGVFPPNTVGPLMKTFGLCGSNLIASSLVQSCNAGTLSIEDVMLVNIQKYPNIPFAYIQSKIDAIQQSFYITLGLTTRGASAFITPSLFYDGVNSIFGTYNALPNFAVYLVDGPMHCFTCLDIMYKTTNYGPLGKRDMLKKDTPLDRWVGQFPLRKGQSVLTECVGDVEDSKSSKLDAEAAEKLHGHDHDHDHSNKEKKRGHDHDQEESDQEHEGENLNSRIKKLGDSISGKFTHWIKNAIPAFNAKTKYCSDTVFPKTFTQA